MKTNTFNRFYKLILFLILTCPAIAIAEPPEWAISGNAVEVTSELEVIYFDDFENNHGEQRYFVHDKQQGKRFELEFQGEPPAGTTTGSFVRIRGQAEDELIYLATDDPSSIEPLAATTAAAMVSGDQNTIVMMTDFNDATVPCSTLEMEKTVFEDPNQRSINDLYRETSLNNMQFTGMVAGPFTIDYSSTDTCETHAWAQAADELAIASGIDLSQYDHKVYVLPKQNKCGWDGSATLGGTPSRAWITQCDMPDVIAHELGHNLGMGHAGTITGTYGDYSDIMGRSSGIGLRQINGPHQEQMGWREPQQIVEIIADDIFDIAPLELDTANAASAQLFKIRKPDTSEWYYLSYRQALGFDQSLHNSYLGGLAYINMQATDQPVKQS